MQKLNSAIPQDAVWILNKLNEGGHEAYIVGGCVRDSILGRMPQDWDITTSALPEETKTIFDHTLIRASSMARLPSSCIMKIMRSQPIASTANMPTAAIRTRSPSPKS